MPQPTPGDPSSANVWGSQQAVGTSIVDAVAAVTNTVAVGGAANVVLTFAFGTLDQTCAAHFILTGVLTGNINVLWPNGKQRVFSVLNSTTGAFTLSLGCNDGTGNPAGTTQTLAQGVTSQYVSDGVNVTPRQSASTAGIGGVTQQSFVGSGAYTPTAGTKFAKVSMVGGGGAGGGIGGGLFGGGGGGAGEFAEGVFTAVQIGAGQTITIGPAGAAASGGDGGTTSLGVLLTAKGGSGALNFSPGASGGTGGSGAGIHIKGGDGANGFNVNGGATYGGQGGSSYFGGGGLGATGSAGAANGEAYGSGGGGGTNAALGAAGQGGAVIITEFQ